MTRHPEEEKIGEGVARSDRGDSGETGTVAAPGGFTSAHLELAAEAGGVGLWDWELTTDRVYYSPEWKAQLGYAEHEIESRFEEWESRLHPEDRETARAVVERYLADPRSGYVQTFRLRHRDGSYRRIEARGRLLRDANGEAVRLVGTHVDVTERWETGRRLEEARERLERAVGAGGVILWEWDLETDRLDWPSEWAERLGFGIEERADGAAWLAAVHEEDRPGVVAAARRVLGNPEEETLEIAFRMQDDEGKWRHFLSRARVDDASAGPPRRLLGASVDITARVEAQAHLAHVQKMDTVGRLAGGIAHDFNNLLTVINGTAELALEDLPGGDPVSESLREILRSGERAARLTRQLLTFGRREPAQRRLLDLARTFGELRRMLSRLLGEDVELRLVEGSGPATVLADPSHLELVLVNLVVNAREAMPEGGTVTVELRRIDAGGELGPGFSPQVPDGPCVLLSVEDTGVGIDPEVRPRIFEPYFSTKSVGRGIGLGLALVYGVVSDAGGGVRVRSEVGRGTRLEIALPFAGEVTDPDDRARGAGSAGGRVLVVEDDAPVLRVIRKVLERAGFAVVSAGTVPTALRAFEDSGPFDLVLTDLVLPGPLSGADLAEEVLERHPGVRVLGISGYSGEVLAVRKAHEARLPMLKKPFVVADLVAKVREVLAGPAPDPAASDGAAGDEPVR